MSVHKKFQPIRSSRLAGYWWHILYECLVLLYRKIKIFKIQTTDTQHTFIIDKINIVLYIFRKNIVKKRFYESFGKNESLSFSYDIRKSVEKEV